MVVRYTKHSATDPNFEHFVYFPGSRTIGSSFYESCRRTIEG
jgi:hypothetical protein